jgi:hypothetical protein
MQLLTSLSDRQLAADLKLEAVRVQTQQQSRQSQKVLDQVASLGEALAKLSVCQPLPQRVPVTATSTAAPEALDADPTGSNLAEFQKLSDQVRELVRASSGPSPEIRILKQLYFTSMYYREDYMRSAEEGTFEWLSEDETGKTDNADLTTRDDPEWLYQYDDEKRNDCRSRLLSWLRNGHGIFHVVGKAGAGKSTLMKLLVRHHRIHKELQHWAGGKTLLFGHFFFWRAGNREQNSLEGLFRSILFETLSRSPELLPDVFPEAYEEFTRTERDNCIDDIYFRSEDLRTAAWKLAALSMPDDCRLCLFIDGLDEYGENSRDKQQHKDLAETLLQWGISDRVKLLVSSRPEKEFTIAFSNPDQCITLHTLTKRDIRLYAQQSLQRHKEYGRISPHAPRLIRQVVDRAEGVFVWAKFAVDTICRALRDGLFDLRALLEELRDLPDEMDEIYASILKSKKSTRERRRACWLLQAVCNGEVSDLHPLMVLQIDNWHNPDFPFSFERQQWTKPEAEQKMEEATSRVNGLSGGLVDICYDSDLKPPFDIFLKPFHRTLHDFVFTSQVVADMVPETKETYGNDFYSRIRFTDVWFCCSDILDDMDADDVEAFWHPNITTPRVLHAALLDHEWIRSLLMSKERPETWSGEWSCTKNGFSFPHWAVFTCEMVPGQLAAWANSENLKNANHPETLSLLLSAALNKRHRGSFKQLLGRSNPNELFSLCQNRFYRSPSGLCPAYQQVTVWSAFCLSFLMKRIIDMRSDIFADTVIDMGSDIFAETVNDFLEAGADCDFHLIFRSGEAMTAVAAPDALLSWAMSVDSRGQTSWRSKLAKLLEATKVTMSSRDAWAHHGITLAGEDRVKDPLSSGQKWSGSVWGDLLGLGKGVMNEDGSVSLKITWTEGFTARMY